MAVPGRIQDERGARGGAPAGSRLLGASAGSGARRWGPVYALGVVATSTALCWATRSWLTVTEQAMAFLLGVLAAAAFLPRRDAVLTALGSVGALDYFFVPPYLGFVPTHPADAVTVAAFLATSLVVSGYATRIRREAESARERERRTTALYAFSRALAGEGRVAEVASIAAQHVRSLLGLEAVVLRPEDGQADAPRVAPCGVPSWCRGAFERDVARLALRSGAPAGRGTRVVPTAAGLYLPLTGPLGTRGVLAVAPPPGPALAASERAELETFAALTAVALERAILSEEADRSHRDVETERMRSALLSGVSHDLRTPLATVTGAAGALLAPGSALSDEDRRVLLGSIRSEGERMARLVTDLLDLTRLEGGGFRLRREWNAADELATAAVERLRPHLGGRRVEIAVRDAPVLVRVDGVLVEQVVWNLVQNAARHTPPGSPIQVDLHREEHDVVLEVRDHGPGIPPEEMADLFEGFHRKPTARDGAGAGLGLALCRAIVRAHGGTIAAENRATGGSTFRVRLPREEEPRLPAEEEAERVEGAA